MHHWVEDDHMTSFGVEKTKWQIILLKLPSLKIFKKKTLQSHYSQVEKDSSQQYIKPSSDLLRFFQKTSIWTFLIKLLQDQMFSGMLSKFILCQSMQSFVACYIFHIYDITSHSILTGTNIHLKVMTLLHFFVIYIKKR